MSDKIDHDTPEAPQGGAIYYGIQEIARFLGTTERQARHLADKKSIPTFKLPKSAIICARRDTLEAWLREHEAAAQAPPPPAPAPPPAAPQRGRRAGKGQP